MSDPKPISVILKLGELPMLEEAELLRALSATKLSQQAQDDEDGEEPFLDSVPYIYRKRSRSVEGGGGNSVFDIEVRHEQIDADKVDGGEILQPVFDALGIMPRREDWFLETVIVLLRALWTKDDQTNTIPSTTTTVLDTVERFIQSLALDMGRSHTSIFNLLISLILLRDRLQRENPAREMLANECSRIRARYLPEHSKLGFETVE